MRVLVACEESGRVRRAFRGYGHAAYSCDLLPAGDGNSRHHFQEDVRNLLAGDWDLMIAHPPCTHLSVSGARWFSQKAVEQKEALEFVEMLLAAPIPRIALENPVSVISSKIRKPDQIIHPWMFGHGETKATCLWLKNLPKLVPTDEVKGREQRVWKMGPSPERARLRSTTYLGIADAMASQWGRLPVEVATISHKPKIRPDAIEKLKRLEQMAGCTFPKCNCALDLAARCVCPRAI